jgi:hypothetical protein
MKKSNLLLLIGCAALFVWTGSCQSPSSADNPAASALATKSDSNTASQSDSSESQNSKTGMGFLQLTLKDAPVEDAKNIWLTITKVRVHEAYNDEDDCFITVWENLTNNVPIDLLKLKDFPITFQAPLPAGTYNQIRMSIAKGEIVFGPPGLPDLVNDQTFPLNVPSDEVKTHLHFEVVSGSMTQITLDLDAKNSIHVIKKGKKDEYQLRPVVNVVQYVGPTS